MPAPIKTLADFTLSISGTDGALEPYVVASPNGGFEIMYSENFGANSFDAETLRFDAFGNSAGNSKLSEGSADINTRETASAFLTDGRQVRVWTEEPNPSVGDFRDVYMDVLYSDGSEDISDTLVGGGAGLQIKPAVAAGNNGRFAVAYEDHEGADSIVLKFYQQSGSLLATRTIADTLYGSTNESYDGTSITGLSNGNYVVAYTDTGFDGKFAIYNSTGTQILAPTVIDADLDESGFPDVIELANGNFLISYYGRPDGVSSATGSIYEADGTLVNSEFIIGGSFSPTFRQYVTSAALDDGRFVTVWVNSSNDIVGQMSFDDGTADGAQFLVSTVTTGTQGRPSIDVLSDGRFVVAWETNENTDAEIKATIYDPREQAVNVSGTNEDDQFVGTGFHDIFITGGGDDVVEGEGGNDLLIGGYGNDELYGGSGKDVLKGGAGSDSLFGGSEDDTLIGGYGSDFLDGEGGADTASYAEASSGVSVSLLSGMGTSGEATGDMLTDIESLIGSNYADVLTGTSTNNALRGGSGNDTLRPYQGGDYVDGGAGIDVLDYSYTSTALDINLATGSVVRVDGFMGVGGYNQTVLNIEFVRGTGGNDVIRADLMNDMTMYGYGGNDVLIGFNGSDRLIGGDGADRLSGGAGIDFHYGEAETDQFYATIGMGRDRIMDWQDGTDKMNFQSVAAVTSFADINVSNGSLGALVWWDDPDDGFWLVGEATTAVDASDFIF